jgi:NADH:ubiquinone oxidoreductase subunit 3 (subunit A)
MTLVTLLIFVPVIVGILLALNLLFAPHHPDAEKTTAYESGFMAITGQTRAPFSIAYYLIAILFLVFDLEIFLLFPFAVTIYTVGIYGFWIVVIFFLVLTFGFIIEIAKGVLNFTNQRSAIAQPIINNSTRRAS